MWSPWRCSAVAIEIERKFLVTSDAWRDEVSLSARLAQAYLTDGGRASVRVRIDGDHANLNIKQAVAGATRLEFEYPIPLEDAETLMRTLGGTRIEKTRHWIPAGDLLWEVDEFAGDNAGLVVAEIELPTVDTAFEQPAWLGEEVTHDLRYYNNELSQRPFRRWPST